MKILMITDLFTTSTNGVVTSVRNLFDELKKQGHDVRILTLSDTTKSRKDGFVYYIRSMPFEIYPNVRMPLSYRHKFIKEIIDWKPDIIHSHCEFFTFQYAKRISKKIDAPIIHTYHTLYEQYVGYIIPFKRLGGYIVKTFSRNRLKRVNTVIAPTYKVEVTLRNYGLKNNIQVVPSGIDMTQHKIQLSSEERSKKRQSLCISDENFVLINLGRLGTEKNVKEIVSYFSNACIQVKNLILLIVGDGPAKEELKKQTAELGITDRVIFTGMIEPSKVQEYYQLGDVFVSASTSETQGLTYVEAAANGLPLLCRKDLCLKDVIIQGENGYEYTNEQEFLSAVKYMINDPMWREYAGNKSKDIASNFDKKSFGNSVEQIYLLALK